MLPTRIYTLIHPNAHLHNFEHLYIPINFADEIRDILKIDDQSKELFGY